MKALSVLEPWASLIIHHGKDSENRSWYAAHRGPLVICSSARMEPGWTQEEFEDALLKAHGTLDAVPADRRLLKSGGTLLAHALGTVDVIGCDRRKLSKWDVEGQHHIRLANPRPFARPFRVCGKLGLWDIPDADVEAAR